MKIQKSVARFVPLVCNEVVTLFVVPRRRMGRDLLEDVLASLGARESDRELHADKLMARRDGRVGFQEMMRTRPYSTSVGFYLDDLCERLAYPSYCTVPPGREGPFSWTIDIFNPHNEDWQYPGYREEVEFLALVVQKYSFKPYRQLGLETRSCNEIAVRYDALLDMVKKMYIVTKADFVFGTAGGHLKWFCHAHHWAVRKLKAPLEATRLLWEWAVYPAAIRDKIVLDPVGLERTRLQTPTFPCAGLWTEELEDNAVLVYAYENLGGEVEEYAETLGLENVLDIDIRPVR